LKERKLPEEFLEDSLSPKETASNASTLRAEWISKWNQTDLSENLYVIPWMELASDSSLDDLDGESSSSEKPEHRSSEGDSFFSERRVICLSPGFLPMRNLRFWSFLDIAKSWKIWSTAGELIAIISRAAALDGRVELNDFIFDDSDEFEDYVLEPHEIHTLVPSRGQKSWLQDDWWPERKCIFQDLKFGDIRALDTPLFGSITPLELLMGEPGQLGALARATFSDTQPEFESNQFGGDSERLSGSDIDVIAVTTDRYSSVRELLKSIRIQLPQEVSVTIVVQTESSNRWKRLAEKYQANLMHVENDKGLAACRNLAVQSTDRKIVFLMDDDFYLDERCRLEAALRILECRPDIAVLGGNLLDVETWASPREVEISQGFAMHMIRGGDRVVWLRLEDAPRVRNFVNPVDYFELCDIVDNFALIRREKVFDAGVFWNPSLKIGAEHQDLYIRLQRQTEGVVARTNALKVRNVRVQSRRYKFMRGRIDTYFRLFFLDLGIRSFSIIGERLRAMSSDGASAYFEQPSMKPTFPPF
jgi:glycosyltransferase involved in cell wall biosynthesis